MSWQLSTRDMGFTRQASPVKIRSRKIVSLYMSILPNVLALRNQTSYYSGGPWDQDLLPTFHLSSSHLLYCSCHLSPLSRRPLNHFCRGPASSQSLFTRSSATLTPSRRPSAQFSSCMGNRTLWSLTHTARISTLCAQWKVISTFQRRWTIMSFSWMRTSSSLLGNLFKNFRSSTISSKTLRRAKAMLRSLWNFL